jgi:hypothetical protein
VDLLEEDFAAMAAAAAAAADWALLLRALRDMSELIYAIAPATLAALRLGGASTPASA